MELAEETVLNNGVEVINDSTTRGEKRKREQNKKIKSDVLIAITRKYSDLSIPEKLECIKYCINNLY